MEVITEAEQTELIEWANQNYTSFIKNGFGRQFQKLRVLPTVPACVWEIKKRVVAAETIEGARQEPLFEDYMGYITDGGKIHPHKDQNLDDLIHTRFNVFVQLPVKGGLPVYGDKVIPVSERCYVRCNSGIDVHTCEMVEGSKARIVLSFGFLLPASV
jgi:hypothetical protein